MNRSKLEQMSVAPDAIDAFISNGSLSPRHQTIMVAALEELDGVNGREAFVRLAGTIADENVALYRQRQAQMYAGFTHRSSRSRLSSLSVPWSAHAPGLERSFSMRRSTTSPGRQASPEQYHGQRADSRNHWKRRGWRTVVDRIGNRTRRRDLASLGWVVRGDAEYLADREQN